MDKNKKRPYSLEQIAERLEWRCTYKDWRDGKKSTWLDDAGMAHYVLPNFYDPQHNYRVRDAVIKRQSDITLEIHCKDRCFMWFSIHAGEDAHMVNPNNPMPIERLWIEALGELKRLEKEGK